MVSEHTPSVGEAPSLRVLVAEREGGSLAESLVRMLRRAGLEAWSCNAGEAEDMARHVRPTVLFLDGSLDEHTTWRFFEAVRRHQPTVRVVALARGANPQPLHLRGVAVAHVTMRSGEDELLEVLAGSHEGRLTTGLSRPSRIREDDPGPSRALQVLTEREKEVLQHLMAGCSNVVIGKSLGISQHTVRTHVQNILSKTGARSRLEAVTVAFREGLPTAPPA